VERERGTKKEKARRGKKIKEDVRICFMDFFWRVSFMIHREKCEVCFSKSLFMQK
jgi:hypothetical protein